MKESKQTTQESPAASEAKSATARDRSPEHFEIAALAVLLAIDHNLECPALRLLPASFIGAAHDLLDEVGAFDAERDVAQAQHPPMKDVFSFKEILTIQTGKPPPPRRPSRSYRPDEPFGASPVGSLALHHRPVGMTMVGCIKTRSPFGLRVAVKPVMLRPQW